MRAYRRKSRAPASPAAVATPPAPLAKLTKTTPPFYHPPKNHATLNRSHPTPNSHPKNNLPAKIKAKSKLTKKEWVEYTKQIWDIPIPSRADLAFVDPPYNMSKAGWDTFKSHDAFLAFTFGWIEELLPKLKADSSLYVFNTPFNSAYILQFLVERKMAFKNWIVWNKQDGISSPKNKFVNGVETILFFTKGTRFLILTMSASLTKARTECGLPASEVF